jgi:steroid delta-isomerase-like uncharacterized protein
MSGPNLLFLAALMALTGAFGCAGRREGAARAEAVERNKTIARRYFNEVWNRGELDALDELLAENYINHSPSFGSPPPGPGGLKPIVAAIRRAFPDLHYEVKDIVATEDAAAIRVRMSGIRKGDLFGLPATNRRVEVEQIQIERIKDNRIVEHWRVTDELSLIKQLGAVERQRR